MVKEDIQQQKISFNLFSFVTAIFLFTITQILGIFIASKIEDLFERIIYLYFPITILVSARELQFILFFITTFLLVSLIFFFMLKFLQSKEKTRLFLTILFSVAIFVGSLDFFFLFFTFFYSLTFSIVAVLLWFIIARVWFHNLIFIVVTASIVATIGMYFSPLIAAIILIILALYDLIAVYLTKHMTVMAKKMIETGVVLGLIVPVRAKDFFMKLSGTVQAREQAKVFFIGGGDIGLPLLLTVSIYFYYGFYFAVATALLSIIGFITTYWLFASQKVVRPIPALPTIIIFPVVAYFLFLLL
jgi:presenilin-like A22 family membrane protease